MEKCRISEVSSLTEQNITDEEKSEAAARSEGQKSRYTSNHNLNHRPRRKHVALFRLRKRIYKQFSNFKNVHKYFFVRLS